MNSKELIIEAESSDQSSKDRKIEKPATGKKEEFMKLIEIKY
jgi:hypothetical protein